MSTQQKIPSPEQRIAALLRAGIPLSLLIDLVTGPRSAEVYAWERPPSRR